MRTPNRGCPQRLFTFRRSERARFATTFLSRSFLVRNMSTEIRGRGCVAVWMFRSIECPARLMGRLSLARERGKVRVYAAQLEGAVQTPHLSPLPRPLLCPHWSRGRGIRLSQNGREKGEACSNLYATNTTPQPGTLTCSQKGSLPSNRAKFHSRSKCRQRRRAEE